MDPALWGPHGWRVLHRMAYRFQDVASAKRFFVAVADLLPCGACREAYKGHLRHVPFPVSLSRVGLWVYDIHHRVNRLKKDMDWKSEPSYAEVEGMYRGMVADPEEWRFVEAIVRHPPEHRGANYDAHLAIFLREWIRTTPWGRLPVDLESMIHSKTKMMAWIRQHAPKTPRPTTRCTQKCSPL